jgi:hypothetical protein
MCHEAEAYTAEGPLPRPSNSIGQTHDKLASLPQSSTACLDCSAVQFHKFLHESQADAQAALRAIKRSIRRREEIEDVGS